MIFVLGYFRYFLSPFPRGKRIEDRICREAGLFASRCAFWLGCLCWGDGWKCKSIVFNVIFVERNP